MEENEREVEELLKTMPRTRKRKRRAGKVKVTYADGTAETVRPGHFGPHRKRPRRNKPPRRYQAYLASAAWKKRRDRVLWRDAYQCQWCGHVGLGGRGLQVHHLTYERVGNEPLEDLVTLCEVCHKGHHRA